MSRPITRTFSLRFSDVDKCDWKNSACFFLLRVIILYLYIIVVFLDINGVVYHLALTAGAFDCGVR